MRKLSVIWAMMGAGVLWAGVAAAASNYDFAFDAANYSVAPGGTVSTQVYLKETVTSGTSMVAGVGMNGVGTKVSFSGAATIQSTADIAANSAFDWVVKSISSADAKLSAQALMNPIAYGSRIGSTNSYWIPIGTFTFTAGLTPGITTISASAYGEEGNVCIRGDDGSALDSLINPGSATIITIPEPSAIVLLGIASATLLAVRWSR
jgi:hypothetical protein